MQRPKSFYVPLWNQRRWYLFKSYISLPSVIETVARYQRGQEMNSGSYPLWAFSNTAAGYLPDGCDEAYLALLNTPGISDQELADLIKPPVEIISHVDKYVGLRLNPSEAYEKYMHKIGADELPDEVDELFDGDTGLYLRIAPHTNVTEIKAFLTKYFDVEMRPHLQGQPIWDTKKSKYMDDRNSKTRKAVGDNGIILNSILAYRAEGKKYAEIAILIEQEYDKYIEVQNLRRMVSDANREGKRE